VSIGSASVTQLQFCAEISFGYGYSTVKGIRVIKSRRVGWDRWQGMQNFGRKTLRIETTWEN